MIRSKLAISSEDYYTCKLTNKYDVKVTIVAINLPVGLGAIESSNGKENEQEIINYINELRESKDITEFKVTHRSPSIYWTKSIHKLDYPSIYETILESGSMTLMPVIIKKGVQYHNILSPSPIEFNNLLKLLNKRFTKVTIKNLYSKPAELQKPLLTNKQSEAFHLAFENGYYEIPKIVKVKELAKKVKISHVSFLERLRRAEKRIIIDYIQNEVF